LPADKIAVKPNFMLKDPGKRISRGEYALFVGRLADLKGIPTMLAAWQRLDEAVPLVIAGDGPFRVEMESEIARRGLSRVLYRGGDDYFYRLTLSTGPRIDFVIPPAGVPGTRTRMPSGETPTARRLATARPAASRSTKMPIVGFIVTSPSGRPLDGDGGGSTALG